MLETIRILQVEDSERDAELIVRAVERSGYEVHGRRVETADALEQALVEEDWDVILIDYVLPRLDGFRALEVVRASSADIPVLVVSGTVGEETAVDLMRAGAADYIMKDNLARLVPAIRRELAEATHRRARREAERRLHERERLLSTAQRIATLGIWEYTFSDDSLIWSDTLLTILGLTPEEAPDAVDAFSRTIHPDDRERVEAALLSAIKEGRTQGLEHRYVRPDGTFRWVYAWLEPEIDASGQPWRLTGTVLDITDRRASEAALRRSEREYRNLFERASDAIVIYDLENEEILDVNHKAVELYGIPKDAFVGRSLRDLLGNEPVEEIKLGIRAGEDGAQRVEAVRQRPDGKRVHLEINASLIEFHERQVVLSIQRDVTTEKELQRQLTHQAFHDALTGLANRALFQDRLTHALSRARARQEDLAVLVLDLDRFKLINESLGHDVGDSLLLEAAGRLAGEVREGDTVARLGGDEFAILLERQVDMREITQVSERVISAIEQPFLLDGHDIVVTSSIGIVIAEGGQGTAEDLLRNADVALYRAKDAGRGSFVIFDPSMNATMLERLRLETDLRQAISRDELQVHFQPTVELATSRVVGLEALVRWRHPSRGLISPAAFIPLAEEAGLIRTIDQWVLEDACRQIAGWLERYPDTTVLLHVNLSAQGFQHQDLVQDVAQALRASGLPPECLQLELTESTIMTDISAADGRLDELKALGVRLAIDDFGTGYSSLSYLKRFPVDTLKVDKSFIDGLGSDAEDTAIVEATISLARALGLSVVAEGVETGEAVRLLREIGCELGQGYFFAAPLPPDDLDQLWNNGLVIPPGWRNTAGR